MEEDSSGNKTTAGGDKQTDFSPKMTERRSQREKKNKRSFSPELDGEEKKKKRKSFRAFSTTSANRPCDILPNGEPFSCHMCKSPYVSNPHSKGVKKGKRSRHVVLPHKRLDSLGREILVCNACNQILDRQLKPKKPVKEITAEQRTKYLEDAKMFAKSLAETLNEPEAEKLYCPVSVYRICGCLQKYIKGDDMDEIELAERVAELLYLMKEASRLREQKCYTIPESQSPPRYGRKRASRIGIGNGHKKSKEFESFVLKNRQHLKEDLHLCERAVQKILLYSNNFLHKKLKTEERPCRITRTKGKAALGQLLDIDTLHNQSCCIDKCVRMSLTHPHLLKTWRARALSGQMEARKVIAEMLTPADGYSLNCYQFVTMVTGCAWATVSKVKNQMRTAGGIQEPTEYGMKKTLTGGNKLQSSSTANNTHTQESATSQTQSNSRQEVTSQLPRPGPESSEANPSPQQDALKLQDLVQRQQELQQQQQLLQFQIQQAVHQNPGWIPQFPTAVPYSMGSINSAFYPTSNMPQTELPVIIPTLPSLMLGHGIPGQLQSVSNQNVSTAAINVPIINPFGSNSAQLPVFRDIMNSEFASVNPGTAIINPQDADFHTAVQYNPKPETNVQRVQNVGGLIVSLEESARVHNNFPNITSNSSHFMQDVINQTPPYLTPSATSNIGQHSEEEQASNSQLPLNNATIHKTPDFTAEPSGGFVTSQISEEKQMERPAPTLFFDSSSTTRQDNENTDFSQAAPRVILTLVDPQKGIAQHIELKSTATETPLILSMNPNFATTGSLAVLEPENILSPAEQQRQVQDILMNTDKIMEGALPTVADNQGSKMPVDLQIFEHSGPYEVNPQYDEERNLKNTPAFSQPTSQNGREIEHDPKAFTMIISTIAPNEIGKSVPVETQMPVQLETVDITFHPNDNTVWQSEKPAYVIADYIDVQKLTDKSTSTSVDHSSSENNKTIDCSADQTYLPSSVNSIDNVKVQERTKRGRVAKNVVEFSAKGTKASSSSSRMCQNEGRTENILGKPVRKHGKHANKPHISREHGFQKLKSKNGKVFLQSVNQRNDPEAVNKGVDTGGKGHKRDERGTVAGLDDSDSKVLRNRVDRRTVVDNSVMDRRDKNVPNDKTSRDNIDKDESSSSASGAKSENIKRVRKASHITDKVKDKLRQTLNIPILPKPAVAQQPIVRMPLALQPLQSSLFMFSPTPQGPPEAQNITNLLHMTKSRVQIQPFQHQDFQDQSVETTVVPHCDTVFNSGSKQLP